MLLKRQQFETMTSPDRKAIRKWWQAKRTAGFQEFRRWYQVNPLNGRLEYGVTMVKGK